MYHGVATEIELVNEDKILYNDIPAKIEVGRYHSWVVSKNLPQELIVTSVDHNGEIMSLKHRDFNKAFIYMQKGIKTQSAQYNSVSIHSCCVSRTTQFWSARPWPSRQNVAMTQHSPHWQTP